MNQELQVIGRRVLHFDRLDSTNSYALSLAHDVDEDGLVVLAGEQSAGRGQHGRSWSAPPGSGVLMSVLLFPPPSLRRPAVLTAWAAVSVCQLIREVTGLHARIKWPNDVLIDERKVCGILIEQRSAGGERLATVVGIGLNVAQPPEWFVETGLTEATSLAIHAPHSLETRDIADRLIAHLDIEYRGLLAGSEAALENCWQRHLGLDGAQVLVEWTGEELRGRLLKASFGGLELDIGGRTVRLQPEGIRHITPCP
jgi:BirA family transcriptional regulator, biotin operon repressor / biotin---[acetyl-CoA-carboxylase] ligase